MLSLFLKIQKIFLIILDWRIYDYLFIYFFK